MRLLPRVRSMSCRVKESTSDAREWVIWVSPLSTAMSLLCGFQCCWKDWPSQRQQEMQTLPIFFTPRYEILSGVLTIAVCTSAGIWQLLKYRAGVGTQTNGGLEEYREVGLKLGWYTFAWGNWSQLPAEDFGFKLYKNMAWSRVWLSVRGVWTMHPPKSVILLHGFFVIAFLFHC